MVKCDRCGTSFARRCTLLRHQRTAQYCKEYQVKNDPIPDKSRDKEFIELKNNVITLQQQIITLLTSSDIKSAVQEQRNVVVNNLQPVSEDNIRGHLDHLTLELILDGASGFASFAKNYPLRNGIVCTDLSRKKLRYKNVEGEIINDIGGHLLAQQFFSATASHSKELLDKEYRDIQKQVSSIASKDGTEITELSELLEKSVKLQDIIRDCSDAAAGKQNELTREFIKQLCT